MDSAYQILQSELEKQKCPDCFGTGKQNDAEIGDISYNEWTCDTCKGDGFLKSPATNKE